MNFSQALDAVKRGSRVTRGQDNTAYIALQTPDMNRDMTLPYLYLVRPGANGFSAIPWTPSQEDIFAEDWEIAPETNSPITQKLYAYKNSHGHPVYLETEFNGNGVLKRWKDKDKVIQ